ncbi:MAG: MFS transporter [Rhabdochlamydiaceae bacterium]|nr:MFS transporter [Candidatus Amphrikana amoebophyrae]
MEDQTQSTDTQSAGKQTKLAIILSNLIHEPFSSLYVWLPFILRKDLLASVFQISLLVTLKPVISILSFYFGSYCRGRNVRAIFLIAGVLARVPFLLFPIFNSIWYFILASTIYMLFYRASIPPWMEILKINLEKKKRQRYFSLGAALGYGEGVFLALYLGIFLDQHTEMWRLLFSIFAAIGIIGVLVQGMVPLSKEPALGERKKLSLLKPWKDTLKLMRERPDFAHFQWGFMAAGFGIMVVIVTLPLYFADVLKLSHRDFANSRYIFMGLGFILCTPLWNKVMSKLSVFQMSSLVFVCFGIFPIAIILAKVSLYFLYAAFVIYGLAQSGSHLLWHLSGPLFADKEDSSMYSGINIVMVGVRGLAAPMLGGLLYSQFGPFFTLSVGMGMCIFGGWYILFKQPKRVKETVL